jgi:hypothetical protein
VILAARGARETERGGVTPVDDPEVARQLKGQASHVVREAVAIAVLVTAVVMLARGLLAAHSPSSFSGPE